MEKAAEIQHRLAEILEGRGTVWHTDTGIHASWVDGLDARTITDTLRELLGRYLGGSSIPGEETYSGEHGRLVLRREYSATAVGVSVLVQHVLWGCQECERTDPAAVVVSPSVDNPERPSSYPGSERMLAVGGAALEERYRELGELLGALADLTGHMYQQCNAAREYLCSIGHLPGLVERSELLVAGMSQ